MTPRRFLAPGKAVILGEYAVLDGAPAIVAAVDVGVDCQVRPSQARRATSAVGDTRFVDAALESANAPPAAYAFGLWRPPDLSGKPGLGGSAAAAVVAIAAAQALRGEALDPVAIFDLAARIHRRVQGSGSGIDVAASAFGGLRRFRIGRAPTPVRAPSGTLRLVWSGHSAQTGPRVTQYRTLPDRERFVRASEALVNAFPDQPVDALRQARDLLCAMADRAGIDYRTPALDRISAIAEDLGGAAKPSGAGGGDIAIAWLPDPDADAAFRQRCAASNLAVLDASVDPEGVRETPAYPPTV